MSDDPILNEPVLLALLTADHVIEEKNGKKGIIGTFTQFNTAVFPVQFPPWAVYASITNMEGEHAFALNMAHTGTSQVVFSIGGKCSSQSNYNVLEFVFPILGLVFVEAGTYSLTLDVDGRQVGSRFLKVLQAQAPTQGG